MGFALPDIPSPPTLCAPVPAMLLFRTGLATGSPWGLPAVLRTSFIARSLVSRIWPYRVCVVGLHCAHRSTDYLFTFSCSPPRLTATQLLSVTGGKLHQGGTLTLLRTLTPKRTSADVHVCQFQRSTQTWRSALLFRCGSATEQGTRFLRPSLNHLAPSTI